MAESITFRKAVNGFNRTDVINYINDLITEKDELAKKAEELRAENEAGKQLIAELEEKVAKASDCATCDLAKKNEVRIGAAMLDARRFSDLIVDEANTKSSKMYEAAALDAYDSAEKTAELAGMIRNTAEEYANSFKELLNKMTALSDSLSAFGNDVAGKKEDFIELFKKDDKAEKLSPAKSEAAAVPKAPAEKKETTQAGVFDPDFNFLDSDSDYTIKIDTDG